MKPSWSLKAKGVLVAIINIVIPLMSWCRVDYEKAIAFDMNVYNTKPVLFVVNYTVELMVTILSYWYLWTRRENIGNIALTLKMLGVFVATFAWSIFVLVFDIYTN